MFLNGWKEIANYLKRGVRTVQRWEHAGIPIHRPAGRSRSAVCAVSEEIDAWIKRTDVERMPDAARTAAASVSAERLKLSQALAEHQTAVNVLASSVHALQQKLRENAGPVPSRPLRPENEDNVMKIGDDDERLRRTG